MLTARLVLRFAKIPAGCRISCLLFCLSWNWRERSSVKLTERAHAKALHVGRESCHPKAALAG